MAIWLSISVLPTRMTAAILRRIPPSLEQAAQLCGASWFMTLRYIVAPLAKRGLMATWVIAYIFCLRDLGITMVVYPPGSDTLPVRYPDINGQWRAQPDCRVMRHFDRSHTAAALCGGSLASARWATTMSMIEFRSVCKDYQGRQVIDMLSLQIEAKERVVLFGPSGCGKSTILYLIAGLVIPDAGDILLNDRTRRGG